MFNAYLHSSILSLTFIKNLIIQFGNSSLVFIPFKLIKSQTIVYPKDEVVFEENTNKKIEAFVFLQMKWIESFTPLILRFDIEHNKNFAFLCFRLKFWMLCSQSNEMPSLTAVKVCDGNALVAILNTSFIVFISVPHFSQLIFNSNFCITINNCFWQHSSF